MERKQISVGDKVKTIYGDIRTVIRVEFDGLQIFVARDPKRPSTKEFFSEWFHPTKVFAA